ncbi:hypothetical protein [Mesorhizobium sp. WSM2561]|uniref:hypothetical protein n=1 Tax=Mesorhizobium sp. WSM2561 TaxID=1040985 RepID=UPI00047F828C|nr:hypothetical protein [Mesorhizobium sp. WSM2561]
MIDKLLAVVDDAATKEKLAAALLELDGMPASARSAPPTIDAVTRPEPPAIDAGAPPAKPATEADSVSDTPRQRDLQWRRAAGWRPQHARHAHTGGRGVSAHGKLSELQTGAYTLSPSVWADRELKPSLGLGSESV